MNYYDQWSHKSQIFRTRLMQFILTALLLGLAEWYVILKWILDAQIYEITRVAIAGGNFVARVMLVMSLFGGFLAAGWIFTWLTMRWPARHSRGDRHHRGAQIIYRDDE